MGLIDSCLILSRPVTIAADIERYHLAHSRSEPQTPVGYTLLFRIGDRAISRIDYPYGPARTLLDGPLLDDPMRLALRAQTSPGRSNGLLRVAVAAELPNDVLEAIAIDADRSHAEGLALWNLPEGRLGLSLGERWFPAGPDVLAGIDEDAPNLPARLREFNDACRPFFDRILYGDPSQEVERLIRSTETLPSPAPRGAAGSPLPKAGPGVELTRILGPEADVGVSVDVSSLDIETTATGQVSVEGYVTKTGGSDLNLQLDLVVVARSVFGDELDRRRCWAKLRTVGDKSWLSLRLNPNGDRIAELAFLFEAQGPAVVCSYCGGLMGPRDDDGCEDCNFTAAMRRRRRGR